MINQIRKALFLNGYFVSDKCWSAEDFYQTSREIGEIIYEADVKLGATRPRNYQLPAPIDFHTDHISAELISWHCLVTDDHGGAMRLFDLEKVVQEMEDDQMQALTRVHIADNAAWGGGDAVPLCEKREGRWRFHYVPWLSTFPADSQAAEALQRFRQAFNRLKVTGYDEFYVMEGQVVFVDNHRTTHGREAISAASKRHLKRLWLKEHASS